VSIIKYDHFLHSRSFLTFNDDCYYFIEATNGGFDKSDSNQLLHNYKKPISYINNHNVWYHRNEAICKFVEYLSKIDNFKYDKYTIIPAPTSKNSKSEEFNDK